MKRRLVNSIQLRHFYLQSIDRAFPSGLERWRGGHHGVSFVRHVQYYSTSDRLPEVTTGVDPTHPSSLVHDILDRPVGSLAATIGWQNVETTIREALHGQDSTEILFSFLDRLVQELYCVPGDAAGISGQDLRPLLNATAYRWRNEYVAAPDKSRVFIQPSGFARKIHSWGKQCSLQGDTSVYSMILEAACSNSKDVKQGVRYADSLLEWMIEQAQEHQNYVVQPSIYSVGVVLEGWVASGHADACQRIEAWIDLAHRLHNEGWPNLKPNTVVYNIFLHSLAQAKNAERAEQVLQSLLEGREGVEPDPISFSTVLLAYTRQESIEAMVNAETLLHQMQELFQSGMDSAKPTLMAFSTVIHGFAQLGQPQPAVLLLNKLLDLYSKTMDSDLEPDITVYNSVVTAWSNAGQPDRADELLREIIESGVLEPNDRTFHAVLHGWAKAGNPDEAETLLSRMHALHADHLRPSLPNTLSYNIVLDAWAKSKRRDSWKRAMDILQHMEDLHESGDEKIQPDSSTWNTVLNCFRYAGPGNFHVAFKVLDRYKAAYGAGMVDGAPNVRTWNTLLAGCIDNTKDDYRVQQLWDLMSKDKCRPDIITYNTTFACFARYGATADKAEKSLVRFVKRMQEDEYIEPSKVTYLRLVEAWIALGRVDKAEDVLSELCGKASSRQDMILVDREPFHRVLLAWSGLKKARRVEPLLLLMHNIHEKYGFEAVRPSLSTYNIVLQAWATSGDKQAGERAEFLLRQMTSRRVQPSRVSYNMVLNAWAESGDRVALPKIESLVLEMILCGKPERCPDETSYNTWMKAVLNDADEQNKTRRVNELLETMKIHNFEPSEFIRNEVARLVAGAAK